MVARLTRFTQGHPRLFDGVVAAFWALLTFVDSEVWEDDVKLAWILPSFAVASVALFWRRRFPREVFALQAIVVIVMTVVDAGAPVPGALLCGTYSLAAHVDIRRESVALFVGFLALGLATTLAVDTDYIGEALVVVLMLGIAWVIGDNLRTRRAYRQSILDRAERAEALRDSLAQQAVAEERTRIARDLHDVVAHSMSLMVVQAGAARRVLANDPAAATSALESIESVGRDSLDEMRRILGVLRGEEETATRPQPDIAALDPLIDEFRAAGLPVEIRHTGDPRPLPATVELTAFRIVQESLTNTLKHAGRANAEVILDYLPASLHIVVQDDGRAPPRSADAGNGSHKGLIGMRERIAVFDGTFRAEQRTSGGYRVSAELPLPREEVSQ